MAHFIVEIAVNTIGSCTFNTQPGLRDSTRLYGISCICTMCIRPIGRKLDGLFLSPLFLCTGMTVADFHRDGNVPEEGKG